MPGQNTTGLWQVCGCAGLCAFGTTIGLVAVLYELGQHTRTPIGALGYAGLALWAGAALGARLRHRLLHTGNINANRPVAGLNHEKVQLGVEFEFAASLAGGLILALGLTWLLVYGVAAGMESCRAFLVQHFLLPPWLTKGLVLGPGLCGLLLVGVIGSTTLIAQRGWLRLLVGPQTNHEPLWLALLCGSITGAGLTIVIANWGSLVVATLTPIFMAGLLAVYRRLPGLGLTHAQPPKPKDSLTLGANLVTVITMLSIGFGCVLALPDDLFTSAALGGILCALAGGALAGRLLGQLCLRRGHDANLLPLFLLLTAVGWAFAHRWPLSPPAAAWLRLICASCFGTICLLLIPQRLMLREGFDRPIVSRHRNIAVATFVLTLLLGQAWICAGTLVLLITLLTTATAGLLLVFDPLIGVRPRVVGICAISLWLWIVFALGEFDLPGTKPVLLDTTHLARSLYTGLGTGYVTASAHRKSTTAQQSMWEIDLTGPRYMVVAVRAETVNQPVARHLIRRCADSLVHGGHLAVELPANELALAAVDCVERHNSKATWQAYLLRVSSASDAHAVLLVGPNIPAWVDQHPWPDDIEVVLQEVENRRELNDYLAAETRVN